MIVVIGVVFSVFLFFAYVCLIIMFNLSLLYHHVLTKIYGVHHLQVIMSSIFCDFTYVRITFWKLQVIMVIIIAVKFRMGIYILILLIVTIRRPRPTATGSAPGNKSCSVSTTNTWNTRERAEGHEFDFGTGGHLRPLAATCSGGHFWLQVAASGCRWKENAGGHWRPLEWLQVAASGCRWKTKCWWPLADTCGHSIGAGGHWRPLAATRLAASGCKWLPMRRKCWWPLAATHWPQGGASGCRWEENDGGHWRPLATTRVAASGCKWLPGVGETICFTIHPLLGGEYWEFWEFSVSCALKIYNILRGRSLGNVKYCTVLLSMLREFLWSEARPIWNVLGHVASRRCVSSNMERR